MDRNEAFRAFSQIHLGTPGERAVFGCFAGAPYALRSAEDAAEAADLDPSDIDEALARFLDAGIVEEVAGMYRWNDAVRYVFERKEPDGSVRDPVCGMPVPMGTRLHTHDIFGRIEHFCSDRCLTSFVVWPIAFTRPRGAAVKEVPGERQDVSA